MAETLPPWTEAPYSSIRADASDAPVWERYGPLARPVVALGTVALIGSWVGFYIITPLPYLEIGTFRATVILHALTGLVLIPYLLSLIARRRLPSGSPLDVPIVLFIGVLLLATATSVNWRVSLEVSLTVLMAVAIFYVLCDGGLFRAWQVEAGFVLASVAAALKGLWISGGDYLDWLHLNSTVRGSFSWRDLVPPTVPEIHDVSDYRNYLGVILAMSFPFLLASVARPWFWFYRLLAALGALAVLIAIFLTITRSTWLGAALGGATTLLLVAVYTERGRAFLRRLNPSTPRRRVVYAGAALAIAVGVIAVVAVSASVQSRPYWLFRPSLGQRADAMGAGGNMVKDYPLLGTGPGAYRLLYPEYSQEDVVHAIHAHNGFLQTAVDMGIPGILTMILLSGALAWILLRGLQRAEGHAQFSLAGAAGAFVALAVFSQLDAPNSFKGPLAALGVVGAIAVLNYREAFASKESAGEINVANGAHLLARALVIPVLIGLLITWGRLDVAQYAYSNGLSNANAHHWSQAADQARQAVDLDPNFAIYRFQYGNVLAREYDESGDTRTLADAVTQLEQGLALEPRSAIGHANLALLYASVNRRAEARDEAHAATHYAKSNLPILLASADALEKTGWDDDAIKAYSDVLFADASLADSPFWQGSAFRREHFSQIVSGSAIIFNPCVLLDLANHNGPAGPLSPAEALDQCIKRVQADPSDLAGAVTLAEAFIKQDSDAALAEAGVLLKQVTDREPDFGPARTALGQLRAARGDVAGARDEWVRGGQLKETDSLILLGDSYPAGQVPSQVIDGLRARTLGLSIDFDIANILYYRYKFFRESPIDILLPGDWQTAVPGRFARASAALDSWTKAR